MAPITEDTHIIPSESRQIVAQAIEWGKGIQGVTIRNDSELSAAEEIASQAHSNSKVFDSTRAALKEPILKQGRVIDAYFKDAVASMNSVKKLVGWEILRYRRAEEAKRRAIAAKAEADARAKRIAAEKMANEALKKAEQYHEQGKGAQAERAAGRAEAIIENAMAAAPPPPPPLPPKRKGSGIRETWKGVITDPHEFVQWAIENSRHELLKPNESAWGQFAKLTKREQKVPGGRIYREESYQTR